MQTRTDLQDVCADVYIQTFKLCVSVYIQTDVYIDIDDICIYDIQTICMITIHCVYRQTWMQMFSLSMMMYCVYRQTYRRLQIGWHSISILWGGFGWLVASIKLQVSFAKEPYKRDDILQKRPIILSILLIVATPYFSTFSNEP